MKWEKILRITEKFPIIDTENLYAGIADPNPIEVQISRWKKAGKIIQLKKGIYILAEPYRKIEINELFIAAILKRPSYISLEKALEYHDLIPEAVAVYTSVTPKRAGKFVVSEIGIFGYRHIKESLFWGYKSSTVNNQTAFIASPEKALLDFFYLNKVKVSLEYLEELRLQNLEKIDAKRLIEYAQKFNKFKMLQVAVVINEYIDLYIKGEKML